jgi:hypothetical protein
MQDKRKAKSCPRGMNHLLRPPRVSFPPVPTVSCYKFLRFHHRRADTVTVHARSDDGTLSPDNALVRWGLALEDAMSKSGRLRPSEELLKARLEKAGFVHVQAFIVKQPIGPWPKAKYGSLDCR